MNKLMVVESELNLDYHKISVREILFKYTFLINPNLNEFFLQNLINCVDNVKFDTTLEAF